MSISMDEVIVLKQKAEGLWIIDDTLLDLIGFNESSWKEFMMKQINHLNNLNNQVDLTSVNPDAIFTMFILYYLRTNYKEKLKQMKLIITKAEKAVKKYYKEYNNSTQSMFEQSILSDA
jgi:hypothetical protein